MGDDVKSFIFFATESLSILHPETKNYKFFKHSKKIFFRHTSSADAQCSKKWKNSVITNVFLCGCTIISTAKINKFWKFFFTPQASLQWKAFGAAPFEK